MAIAFWKAEYITGNSQIDQEHQTLFGIVNTLHTAILDNAESYALQEIFNQLAIHTVEHFQSEEQLMQANDYPGFDRHKQAHDGLLTKVTTLMQQFETHDLPASVKLTEFLTEWLAHHIKGEDQKMIRFFQEEAAIEHSTIVSPATSP